MKNLIIFFLLLFCKIATAQYVISDDSIKGATYIKSIKKYIAKGDSATLRKANKKAKFKKEKIDTSFKLLYDEVLPIAYFDSADFGNHYKHQTVYYRASKANYTGRGIKVAILDTGVDTVVVPVPQYFNHNDYNTGLPNIRGKHGTNVGSHIQSKIGMANGVELHYLKIIDTDIHGNAGNSISEALLILALNYCQTNQIDIVNCSFQYGGTANVTSAFKALMNSGTIVVAATGNSGTLASMVYPSNIDSVVAVNNRSKNNLPSALNIQGSKPVSCAIGGVSGQYIEVNDALYGTRILVANGYGTSFSAPIFVSILACKLEELRKTRADNYKVLNHVLKQCYGPSVYFGNGTPTF